jgi:serine/threonine protein kinase
MTHSDVSEPIAIMSGSFVGPYRVEQRLSVGGMAELFFARLPGGTLGVERPAVIKALTPALARNPQWRSMFHHEARVAALLDHPNLVRFLDLHVQQDRPYIVLEYVHGQNLRQVMRRALQRRVPIGLGPICRIVADVLAGLGHMHEQLDADGQPMPLIHRDVSPTNIMCTFAGTMKLVDFGIAKSSQPNLRADLTAAGQFKGKCAYSAPEQVRCNAVDARSDVFSTGIVLWELLTGKRLFMRRSELESMRAVVEGPIPPVAKFAPDVPPALAALCGRALERDPRLRYQSARDMRADLERIMIAERWDGTPLAIEQLMGLLFEADERRDGAVLLGDEALATQVDLVPPIALRLASAPALVEPAPAPRRELSRRTPALVALLAVVSVLVIAVLALRGRGAASRTTEAAPIAAPRDSDGRPARPSLP